MAQLNDNSQTVSASRRGPVTLGQLTEILSALAALAAVFYGLGYLIVNFRLLDLGARDFSLKNPSYLAAGVLFTLLHAFFIIAPIALVLAFKRLPGRRKLSPAVQFLVVSLVSFIITFLTILFINGSFPTLQFAYPLLLAFFVATGLMTRETGESNPEARGYIATFATIWAVFALLVLLYLWSWGVYPYIKPGYGGGQPIAVQFVIANQKQAGLFEQIGIGFVDKNTTDKLFLVDDNGSTYVVLIDPSGQAARIDKQLVSNILYWTPHQLREIETKTQP